MADINLFWVIGGIGIGLLFGYFLARILFMGNVAKHRRKAVKHSKATTMGFVQETLAPIMPDFPYHYKDLMFMGKGVDYVVFDGLHEGHVRKVVFVEIKTGQSRLNKNEQAIKKAIDAGRVAYKVLRISNKS